MQTHEMKGTDEKPAEHAMRMSPLTQLANEIRRNKYNLSAQETLVAGKCDEDARWFRMNVSVLFGGVTWGLTGLRGTLKVFPTRIAMSACAGIVGLSVANKLAGYTCMERILGLTGSPMRGELIAILQRDYPHSALLRKTLDREKSAFQQPVSDAEWLSREGNEQGVISVSDSSPVNKKSLELQRNDSGDGQEIRPRIPRILDSLPSVESIRNEEEEYELLVDPFDLVDPEDIDTIPDTVGDVVEDKQIERRRSRMTSRERSAYNRRQYEERQQQSRD